MGAGGCVGIEGVLTFVLNASDVKVVDLGTNGAAAVERGVDSPLRI